MADPSALASYLAVFIFVLGVAHARHPWVRYDGDPGHHRKWESVFAICIAVSLVATCIYIGTGRPSARLFLLSWPWINGLVIEVYVCWQVFGLFRPLKGMWIYQYGTCLVGGGTIIVQLCGLYVADAKVLAFVGCPLFHGLMTSPFVFLFLHYRWTRHRKFVFIGCSYVVATVLSVTLSVMFYREDSRLTNSAPIYCLAHATLELVLLTTLLFIRKWERTTTDSQNVEANLPNGQDTATPSAKTGHSVEETSPRPTTPSSEAATLQPSAPSSLGAAFPTQPPDEYIVAIGEIIKTEDGVSASVFLQHRMDWHELRHWKEAVTREIGGDAYKLADALSSIKGAAGRVIFANALPEAAQS